MSGRRKRATTRPVSYKDFNETGQKQLATAHSGEEQSENDDVQTDEQNSSQSAENSIDDGSNATIDNNITTSTPRATKSKKKGKKSTDEADTTTQNSSEDTNSKNVEAHKHDKHAKHDKHDKGRDQVKRNAGSNNKKRETSEGVELFPNSEEDDFDEEIILKTPKHRGKNTSIKTPNKLNTSKRVSVADRLYMLPTPIKSKTATTPPLAIETNYIAESRRADKDETAAKEMLLHAQREAELAKRRLAAEEMRRKTMALQKEADRTNKKAEQEKVRYVKQAQKSKKTVKIRATSNQQEPRENSNARQGANAISSENNTLASINNRVTDYVITDYDASLNQVDNNETIDSNDIDFQINKARQNARKLNPLRKTRRAYTGTDGSNNPNFPGQDNGHNAWLDAQLNAQEIDTELHLDTKYAKKNSDHNRMYDIDDIPIRGPPKQADIPSDISIEDATQLAEKLINEDYDLYNCRSSGIRKAIPKKDKRKVASTISRADSDYTGTDNHKYKYTQRGHNYRNRRDDSERYRYEMDDRNWDTDTDKCDTTSISSEEATVPKSNINKKRKHNKSDVNFRSPLQLQAERDLERFRINRRERLEQPSRLRRDRYNNEWSDNGRRREERDTTYNTRKGRRTDRYNENRGRNNSLSDEYSSRSPKRGQAIRSGINARPESSVCEQHTYPQFSLGQLSGYIGQILDYHKLTYEEFMAGELMTIKTARDPTEKVGRLDLLSNIAQWRLRSNVSWPQVRSAYATILRKVENREIDWEADWERQERHIYDKVAPVQTKIQRNTRTTNTSSTGNEVVWFCRNYQKIDGCPKDSPHGGRVGNTFKQLYHICAACWLKDKIKNTHPECSTECPHHQQ